MAVPTITSVTPSFGSTRGTNVIRIEGTNFRLPNAVAAEGPLQTDQQKTVSIQFEGVESEWAYSATAGLILAKVPTYAGPTDIDFPAELDLRVANLDDAGVEIAGENATLTDGYTISRPGLATESYLQRTIREVIRLYRRHVLANTHHTTARDYSLTPDEQKTLRASGPMVQLMGPRLPVNRFYSLNREPFEADSVGGVDGMMRKKTPVTCDVVFSVALWANSIYHLEGLIQGCLLLHRDIKFVKVDVDPSDPTKGTKDYEFEMPWDGYPETNTDPTTDDLLFASLTCVVRGVHIDEDFGTIVERGWIVSGNDGYPTLESQPL